MTEGTQKELFCSCPLSVASDPSDSACHFVLISVEGNSSRTIADSAVEWTFTGFERCICAAVLPIYFQLWQTGAGGDNFI
jgi:hypothetical protein